MKQKNGHGDYDLMTTYEETKKKGKRKPVHTTRAATAQEIRQDLKQTERNRLRGMKPRKIRKKI
jgi:hypothetical protein